ncbi:MAG TPA: HEAT repeat domain-containing protein [Ktedonobacteraceae bacterium]|nr:HEAT repeat domain-containing protein [Ktedonobacteraceae bacterium]
MRNASIYYFTAAFQQRRTLLVSVSIILFLAICELLPAHGILAAHLILLLLLLLFDLIISTAIGWITAEPLAIHSYAKAVQKEQKTNSKVYTALVAVKNLYETPTDASTQYEQQDIREIAREGKTHLLILGLPGAGKTMALRAAYQFPAFSHPLKLARGKGSVPVYIPLKDYNAFLGKTNLALHSGLEAQGQSATPLAYPETILAYLQSDNGQVGLNYLRPYLTQLAKRGRLLFLCDGLNEIDSERLALVCNELKRTMLGQQNRLAMTCRELDYREQPPLRQLVGQAYAEEVLLLPLKLDQIEGFVEQYVQHARDQVGPQKKYSAYEINTYIKGSRLSYNCTNPMMLVTLIETIDEVGLDNQDLKIGSRGRLLSRYISRLVTRDLARQGWKTITEQDIVLFLSLIACTARRCKLRNAIQLGRAGNRGRETARTMSLPEIAARLQLWLDGNATPETDMTGQYTHRPPAHKTYTQAEIEQLALFAQSAALITLSQNGVLSFRHELIAEYFAARYLYTVDSDPQAPLPFGNELVTDIGAWSEPVAMWAGMSEDPIGLAKRLANLAQSFPQYSYNALSLSLLCAGVRWGPLDAPQLPENISQLLVTAVLDSEQRAKLAETLRRSADEGGIEVYRALLPLIMEAHIDDLLLLLDKRAVPELLFDYLRDAVEAAMPQQHIARLVEILGRFGQVVIPRAIEMSKNKSESNLYVRVEALNVLGSTRVLAAVEPLIDNLGDGEQSIVDATVKALVHLGPGLTLDAILNELKSQVPKDLIIRIHWAALAALHGFLTFNMLKPAQHQRTIEALLIALSSTYNERISQEARRILFQQVDPKTRKQDEQWRKVIDSLIRTLADRDETRAANVKEVLQQVGRAATPLLLAELSKNQWEVVKARIIAVLRAVRDPAALQPLLPYLDDPFPQVREQGALALRDYAPESIDFLINMVQFHQKPGVAERAAAILQEIGTRGVQQVIAALERIVPGRTQLLIGILVQVHDERAIAPLIGLLKKMPDTADTPLTITVIQALGNFTEREVVLPLLDVLIHWQSPFFEAAGKVLSGFGRLALAELLTALDVQQETTGVQRVRKALLTMDPFLSELLLAAVASCSEAQMQHIKIVFLQKGDMAAFLVENLSHPDERVRQFVLDILGKMRREQITPPLLHALKNRSEIDIIAGFLLKYSESIPPLVDLLSDHERNDAATIILLRFGTAVIPHLVPGLNHATSDIARSQAYNILVRLVHQERAAEAQKKVLMQVIGLLAVAQRESYAWYIVLDIVTGEFADMSIALLLQALEREQLQDGCAEALVRLTRRDDGRNKDVLLNQLLAALRMPRRRVGAAETLVRLDADAVGPVSAYIVDEDETVRLKAQEILSRIGPAALRFVWDNYRNANNSGLQRAAYKIFSDMPTEKIKDELIWLLVDEKNSSSEMALALLQERIIVEGQKPAQEQKMVAALIDYVQKHGRVNTNLRVIAVLLLQNKDVVIPQLISVLRHQSDYQEWRWLIQLFLLLGREGGKVEDELWKIMQDPAAPLPLQREVVSVMGLLGLSVESYATSLNALSPVGQQAPATIDLQQREKFEIALRALVGLIAGGKWDSKKLENLLLDSAPGSPTYDLYSILLGKQFSGQIEQYEQQVLQMKQQLKSEQATYSKQLQVLQDEHDREKRRLNDDILRQKKENRTITEKARGLEHRTISLEAEVTRLQQQLPPMPQQNQGF